MVALSGCVTELLQETQETTRNITCAVLQEDLFPVMHVHVYGAQGVAESWPAAIANGTGRSLDSIRVSYEPVPDDFDVWSQSVVRLDDDVHLHVVFGELAEGTMQIPAPGILVLSLPAIEAGAAMIDRPIHDVTRIVALHGIGHLLGVVNAGTPLNSTQTEGRESGMHHEPSPQSIMFSGWHDPQGMPKTQADYATYSDAVRDDWHGARGSICS